MRFFGLLTAGLVLGGSTAVQAQTGQGPEKASAQTVKPADLVGSWARQGQKDPALVFRADSTFVALGVGNAADSSGDGQPIDVAGRWGLVGDTLKLARLVTQIKGQRVNAFALISASGLSTPRRVELEGRRLTLTPRSARPTPRVYERLDSRSP